MRHHWEFWDAHSTQGLNRKMHPVLRLDSGMQFPVEGRSGKRIPLWNRIPGRSFRMRRHSKQKAPARDGAGAKGAAYAVDGEREQPVSNAVCALP